MPRSLTDLYKIIAAIAVVGIHATSQSETRFAAEHDINSLDFLSVVVNQWARFSVPLFIYFSAYGLTISQKQNEDIGLFKTWLAFLSRRLPTILVPYLFFSGIALAMEFHSCTGPADALWISIATKLRTGGADYHLYFLVILAQCYLLFPVLSKFARQKTTAFSLTTWLALILVSGLLYKGSSEILLGKLGAMHPGWHASFVVYWLPYFMLGVLHALEPPRPVHRVAITIALIVAQAIVLFEYIHYSWQGTPVDYYNHFSRPSVMFYAMVVVWWLHSVSPSAFGTSPASGGGREGDKVARLAPSPSAYILYTRRCCG
jgi:surface polysaccharide O-acyltransferase-like enzyme